MKRPWRDCLCKRFLKLAGHENDFNNKNNANVSSNNYQILTKL